MTDADQTPAVRAADGARLDTVDSAAGDVISVDAMSGDAGPGPVVAGLTRVLRTHPDLRFLLHGDRARLEPLLARRRHAALAQRVTLEHADDVVRMDDLPSRAVRNRRHSSMAHAIAAVRDGRARVVVSCGNTGAMMAMAMLMLRTAPGVDRPAIAVHWPARQPHGFNTVLDVGADIRAHPADLARFAVMGAAYARLSLGIQTPRVGLLNLGTEPHKGHADLREALALIEAGAGAYAAEGFVEGTDIPGDRADVIVTDGFTGNIALKTAEGTAAFIRQGLRDAFRHSLFSRIGTLFALTSLRRFSKRIDPRRVNGGVFLGLNGSVVKSHGRADAVGVAAAVELAADLARGNFAVAVAREIAGAPAVAPPQATTVHAATPGTATPGAKTPDAKTPDSSTPDASSPGDPTPGSPAQGAAIPETPAQGTAIPGALAQGAATPETPAQGAAGGAGAGDATAHGDVDAGRAEAGEQPSGPGAAAGKAAAAAARDQAR